MGEEGLAAEISKRKQCALEGAVGGAGKPSGAFKGGASFCAGPSQRLQPLAGCAPPQASPEARGFMHPCKPLEQLAPGAASVQEPRL